MKSNYFKMLMIVFVISLFSNTLFAQGAYVKINAGYGMNMSSFVAQEYSQSSTNIPPYSYSYTTEAVNYSLGKGLNFGGAFGYMFNKNIGAELGISYLLGGTTKIVNESNFATGHSTFEQTMHSNMLRFIPSVVIASGFEGINPYAKFGLLIGTGSFFVDSDANDDGDIMVENWKYNGGFALGLNSAIGAMFTINDNISIFGEIDMVNLSYAPTKAELTEASLNGVDQLPTMTTREKETEYVDSYTFDSANPVSDSEPAKEVKFKMPYGSVGLNVGLKISF
jgi:hypothetical protein